jgi:hypothetical protein
VIAGPSFRRRGPQRDFGWQSRGNVERVVERRSQTIARCLRLQGGSSSMVTTSPRPNSNQGRRATDRASTSASTVPVTRSVGAALGARTDRMGVDGQRSASRAMALLRTEAIPHPRWPRGASTGVRVALIAIGDLRVEDQSSLVHFKRGPTRSPIGLLQANKIDDLFDASALKASKMGLAGAGP